MYMDFDYAQVFSKFEESLKNNLFISESEFNNRANRFLSMDFREKSDKEIFWTIVQVTFYSGIKAIIIEQREEKIKENLYDYESLVNLTDEEKIGVISKVGFPKKCQYCFKNAVTFQKLISEFGSFQNYISSFGITNTKPKDFDIDRLKTNLRQRFYGLGPRTVNHFLTDLGFNVLKPDRVVCRIFHRLGLIDSVEDIEGTIREGKKFETATGKSIRYIDIIFVKYGQMGKSEVLGTKEGICLEKNPNCQICKVNPFCKYYQDRV